MLKWTLRGAAIIAITAAIATPVAVPAPEAAVATPAVAVVASASGPDAPGAKLASAVKVTARLDHLVAYFQRQSPVQVEGLERNEGEGPGGTGRRPHSARLGGRALAELANILLWTDTSVPPETVSKCCPLLEYEARRHRIRVGGSAPPGFIVASRPGLTFSSSVCLRDDLQQLPRSASPERSLAVPARLSYRVLLAGTAAWVASPMSDGPGGKRELALLRDLRAMI